ncbi:DUF1998 domain-containing protein [Thermoflavimicrobium daqui]|nr:DUF1998 domain-containing protein [Thermoflavimicrobium daqui]
MTHRKVRRSQLISPWGVGQMINFRSDESLMVCGLDAWEREYKLGGEIKEFKINEERLQKRLGVKHFRLPPDYRVEGAQDGKNKRLMIPSIRFPLWHFCPRCGDMEKLSIYSEKTKCKGREFKRKKSEDNSIPCRNMNERSRRHLIPIRFIAVCEHGHIEDFPFMEWVHRGNNYSANCRLTLETEKSSGLSGILIKCTCGKQRTMKDSFNHKALSPYKKCSGNRPWLGEVDNHENICSADLRVVQKGASNVYFPHVISSIYVPQWESTAPKNYTDVLEEEWDYLMSCKIDGELDKRVFDYIARHHDLNHNVLYELAVKKLENENKNPLSVTEEMSEEQYRQIEYEAILSGLGGENQEFFVTRKDMNDYDSVIRDHFSNINLLHKLRETRAFVGFSRLIPNETKTFRERKEELSLKKINWLPAIIVKGEGFFIEFHKDKLSIWEKNLSVIQRVERLKKNIGESNYFNHLIEVITPRFLLIHTFAHALINQLSFECGYGSSALRERIYCGNDMQGVLIYTASGDSEGSLGGLVRQGNPDQLKNVISSALTSIKWCSSDPVCMESGGQGPNSCNLAACHSCVLLPETSCEWGNRLLDRSLLIGTFEQPEIGYFSGFYTVDSE